MKLLSTLLVLFVAVEHFYIAWLEMTQIPSEKASELFNMPYEFMEQKRVQTLFSNQGLYNGFLAIGLVWERFAAPDNAVYGATILFLGFECVEQGIHMRLDGGFAAGNDDVARRVGFQTA